MANSIASSDKTCAISRYVIAAIITGLGLILAASGCSKSEAPARIEPQADSTPDPEMATHRAPEALEDAPVMQMQRDHAVFMGTRAHGRRFCIIADASNSMKGAPLEQLKKEILKTLDGLSESSQFYIIFFNASDIPMPYPGWLFADKESVDKVKPWVQNMGTLLKTLPGSSFERAFKLEPKPDVIFFMTDGMIHEKKFTERVARLNAAEPRTAIHTIMFSKRKKANDAKLVPAIDLLRVIAEKNGGTFRQVSQN